MADPTDAGRDRPRDPAPEPPTTRREPVTETLHGTAIDDPYRWLEGDGDAVADWVQRQNERVDTALDTPTRDGLRPRFEALADVAEYGHVVVREGRYFTTVREPDADHPRLVVKSEPDGAGRVLVDPNRWPANREDGREPRSMAWFVPAHDGERVAVGVTTGGDENYDVRVLSVPKPDGEGSEAAAPETLAVLPERGRVNPGGIAWEADGDGLVYVATGGAAAGAQMDKEVRRYRLDDASAEGTDAGESEVGESDAGQSDAGQSDAAEAVLLEHDDRHVWPRVTIDPESGLLAVAFSEMAGGTEWYVRVDGDLRPVLADTDAETAVRFHGGTAFLRTDHDAPRKRLLACPTERFREGDLDLDACREVLPEAEGILQSVAPTPDRLVAHYQRDACSRLAVFDRDGSHRRDLPLSDHRSVTWLTTARDAPEALYGVTGFDRPPATVRVDLAAEGPDALTDIDAVDVAVPDDLVVEQAFVDSTDGASVPVFVCYREDARPSGSEPERPAMLYGYGGFRNGITPSFRRFRLPFLADGGVFAAVCARGGDEYGESWHEAGMLAEKQHTFDDFIAAAEWLCEAGHTTSDRLAVGGGSNGGLSVGAVITQRPDLFAAAQCAVPLLDMLRFHRFLLGESWTTEYGHPEDPEAFEYLRAYSPYHNVDPEESYPPTLFTTAAGDTRVHPSHARKMAARLQNEADGGPFLCRTKPDTGHGVGKPTSMVVDENADAWTFLYDQLEVEAPGDAPPADE